MSREDDPFGIKENPSHRETSIVKNRDKLKISHIPDKLQFRQKEIQKIVNDLFVDALEGNEGQDAVITGEPGTGKTAVMKYVLSKLEDNYDTSRMDTVYVNCKTNSSQQEVFKAILNSLDLEFKRGIGLAENIETLFQEYRRPEHNSLVIVLDEVDSLYKSRREYLNDVLYTLSRPDEHSDGFRFAGSLNVVCVSNDDNMYNYLDIDVDDSSFSPEKFEFLPYSVNEITEILLSRQEEAYKEQILDRQHMTRIAEVVAHKFNSDIRVGIRILKKIPKNIDSDLEDINQSELVEDAIEGVKRSRIEKVLNGKDKHFLLITAGMLQNYSSGKSKLSYIVDSYRGLCEAVGVEKNENDFGQSDGESRARSRSYVRRRLDYLVEENILEKQKRYDKPRNPYFYKPTVDVDLFLQMVEERLEKKGLEKVKSDEDRSFLLDQDVEDDLEKLDKMVSGSS